MSQEPAARRLATEFAMLNDYLRADDPGGGMQRLVDLAAASVPGCRWAAITSWPTNRAPRTLASTAAVALETDQLQYDIGDGPCLRATTETEPQISPDLATETRWPRFAAAAQDQAGVHGVLSFHLTDEPARTALNLYAGEAGAFDRDAVNTGTLFAIHARVLMLHAESISEASNLTQALSTSRQIGAAIGILMSAHKIIEEEAYDLLRAASQRLNRKVRDIAQDVTDTGELPDNQ